MNQLIRCVLRPNPSLEPTPTGYALGPRGACSYHPPRGLSAPPPGSPQLKRYASEATVRRVPTLVHCRAWPKQRSSASAN